jgi:hypothetical protein
MARRIQELEHLATQEVGKERSPLIFVTENGTVRAVFTLPSDMDAAVEFAHGLSRNLPVVIEDCTGVAWENAMSQRQQMERDE